MFLESPIPVSKSRATTMERHHQSNPYQWNCRCRSEAPKNLSGKGSAAMVWGSEKKGALEKGSSQKHSYILNIWEFQEILQGAVETQMKSDHFTRDLSRDSRDPPVKDPFRKNSDYPCPKRGQPYLVIFLPRVRNVEGYRNPWVIKFPGRWGCLRGLQRGV